MKDGVIPSSTDQLVGRRVREHRIAIGLTQQALALHLRVSPQQVQRYEAGINRLSPSLLVGIAERLGCTVGQLFGETPPLPASGASLSIFPGPSTPSRRRYRRRD